MDPDREEHRDEQHDPERTNPVGAGGEASGTVDRTNPAGGAQGSESADPDSRSPDATVPDAPDPDAAARGAGSASPPADESASSGPAAEDGAASNPDATIPVGRPQDPLVGQVLGGCKIEQRIGEGAMGAVYRAVQVNLDRTVAVKTIRPELVAEERLLQRFQQEAKTVGRFKTPYVVQIHQVGYQRGVHFLVMEYVDGGDLRTYASQQAEQRIGTERAVRFLRQCAEGLEEAERQGVLHRDIKPENLLLDERENVKIADFGIAKILSDDMARMTLTQDMVGTPMYMSPEACKDADDLDWRTDMYSLGATFFFLVTGRPPVQSRSVYEVIQTKTRTEFLSPQQAFPELQVHGPLSRVIERMTKLDRDERYGSWRELVEDLDRVEAGEELGKAPRVRRGSASGKARPGARRRGGGDPERTREIEAVPSGASAAADAEVPASGAGRLLVAIAAFAALGAGGWFTRDAWLPLVQGGGGASSATNAAAADAEGRGGGDGGVRDPADGPSTDGGEPPVADGEGAPDAGAAGPVDGQPGDRPAGTGIAVAGVAGTPGSDVDSGSGAVGADSAGVDPDADASAAAGDGTARAGTDAAGADDTANGKATGPGGGDRAAFPTVDLSASLAGIAADLERIDEAFESRDPSIATQRDLEDLRKNLRDLSPSDEALRDEQQRLLARSTELLEDVDWAIQRLASWSEAAPVAPAPPFTGVLQYAAKVRAAFPTDDSVRPRLRAFGTRQQRRHLPASFVDRCRRALIEAMGTWDRFDPFDASGPDELARRAAGLGAIEEGAANLAMAFPGLDVPDNVDPLRIERRRDMLALAGEVAALRARVEDVGDAAEAVATLADWRAEGAGIRQELGQLRSALDALQPRARASADDPAGAAAMEALARVERGLGPATSRADEWAARADRFTSLLDALARSDLVVLGRELQRYDRQFRDPPETSALRRGFGDYVRAVEAVRDRLDLDQGLAALDAANEAFLRSDGVERATLDGVRDLRRQLQDLKARVGSAEMVGIPAGTVDMDGVATRVEAFFIGREELTWERFRRFWEAAKNQQVAGRVVREYERMGGVLERQKRELEAAMRDAVDGRPAEGMNYFMARACALHFDADLPTVAQWRRALAEHEGQLEAYNPSSVAVAARGELPVENMPGNVAEWCRSVDDGRAGVLMGGSYKDNLRTRQRQRRGLHRGLTVQTPDEVTGLPAMGMRLVVPLSAFVRLPELPRD